MPTTSRLVSPFNRASPSGLPPELIHGIISTLRSPYCTEIKALAACTLICKAWHAVARSHLFHTLRIKSPPSGERFDEFLVFADRHPDVVQYVQNLYLHVDPAFAFAEQDDWNPFEQDDDEELEYYDGPDEEANVDEPGDGDDGTGEEEHTNHGTGAAVLNFPAFLAILPRLPALRGLRFGSIALRVPRGITLTPYRISLDHLLINTAYATLDQFFMGLSVASVDTLYLGSDNFNDRAGVHGEDRSRIVVRKLSLCEHATYTASFDYYEASLCSEALRDVEMPCKDWTRVERLCGFLGRMGENLQQLQLDFRSYFQGYGPGESAASSLVCRPTLTFYGSDWSPMGRCRARDRVVSRPPVSGDSPTCAHSWTHQSPVGHAFCIPDHCRYHYSPTRARALAFSSTFYDQDAFTYQGIR